MSDESSESEGPKQTVKRMPAEEEIGPFYPSGMSAPEAALAGATEGMTDEQVAALKGEAPSGTAEAEE